MRTRDGAILPVKIQSHLGLGDLEQALATAEGGRWPWGSLGKHSGLHASAPLLGAAYVGNYMAGALASRTCMELQLPAALVSSIRAEDALGGQGA